MPTGVSTATSSVQNVERTEQNLVHSLPSTSRARTVIPVVPGPVMGQPSGSPRHPGQVQIGLLQRGGARDQGVHGDAMLSSQVADGRRVQAGHGQSAIVLPADGRAAGGQQSGLSAVRGVRSRTSWRRLDWISSAVVVSAISRPRPMTISRSAVCAISLIR
jgi:hypothetical protein